MKTIFLKFGIVLLAAGVLYLTSGCTEPDSKPAADTILQVGDRAVSTSEFRLFYELDPNFAMDASGIPALTAEIQLLADQILAHRYAEKQGLTEDDIFQRSLQWEQRQAMLRQLYRSKISDAIQITESEERQYFSHMNQKVRIRHLFSEDAAEIERWKQELEQGRSSFSELARVAFTDSMLAANGGELGWIPLSELDAPLVTALNDLPAGTISEPVKSRWGYHLLEVLDRNQEVMLNESDFQSRRPSIEKKLRQIKGQAKARLFVQEYVGSKNPQPQARAMQQLWYAVVPPQMREYSPLPHELTLDPSTIDRAEALLGNRADQVLISYSGGSISIADYLSAVRRMPISHRPRFDSVEGLSDHMARWIRDELLMDLAREQNLQNHERVTSDLRRFTEEQSYYFYLNQIEDTLTVPDPVRAYFDSGSKPERLPPDFPELRSIHTLQEWTRKAASDRLRQLLRREIQQNLQIDIQRLREENNRVDWDRPIRMFMVRKPS